MENRSHALMAGIFTLVLLAAAAVAIWIGRTDPASRIVSATAVSGLNSQSTVRYQGVPVGRSLALSEQNVQALGTALRNAGELTEVAQERQPRAAAGHGQDRAAGRFAGRRSGWPRRKWATWRSRRASPALNATPAGHRHAQPERHCVRRLNARRLVGHRHAQPERHCVARRGWTARPYRHHRHGPEHRPGRPRRHSTLRVWTARRNPVAGPAPAGTRRSRIRRALGEHVQMKMRSAFLVLTLALAGCGVAASARRRPCSIWEPTCGPPCSCRRARRSRWPTSVPALSDSGIIWRVGDSAAPNPMPPPLGFVAVGPGASAPDRAPVAPGAGDGRAGQRPNAAAAGPTAAVRAGLRAGRRPARAAWCCRRCW